MEAFFFYIFPKLNNGICYYLLSHDIAVDVCLSHQPLLSTLSIHCFSTLVTLSVKIYTSLTIYKNEY